MELNMACRGTKLRFLFPAEMKLILECYKMLRGEGELLHTMLRHAAWNGLPLKSVESLLIIFSET